jgi:nicotinate-nucleotide adenylyltransferase
MERLGIFGGTFDPPHNAHLLLARESCRQLDLARVLWVLTPAPPHKERPDITPYPLRREMLLAAISGEKRFVLDEVESERPGPHYMADTIRILQSRHAGSELFLLLGEDSLRDLPLWHRPADVVALCPLVVMRRPGAEADLAALEKTLPGITARTRFIETPALDISSTRLRELAGKGQSIQGYVPKPVDEIIHKKRLYSSSGIKKPAG